MIMDIPDFEEIYVGGDFNGHVGRTNMDYVSVHGGWGSRDHNEEGYTLVKSCVGLQLGDNKHRPPRYANLLLSHKKESVKSVSQSSITA